ncbi:helix-turn-helix domain-containing protein [Saprospiraceae bacterium]|nr:helix-turn-helix domain-containing protein [Saprospiraceae bacterium]
MHDLSYSGLSEMSDDAIEQSIGYYIKRTRQQQNKTQKELANAANISRSTLSLLERGESVKLRTLIQVLRVLDQIQLLQIFVYNEQLSPIALAKLQHKAKARVRNPQAEVSKVEERKSDW